LWAFNEEVVVRAIHASRIPVISAVGHEIDVTLADLVADIRALTPSEAAERVVPAVDAIYRTLRDQKSRLENALRNRSSESRRRLESIENRRSFKKPFDQLHDRSQQLDWWQTRSARAVSVLMERTKSKTTALAAKLESLSPLAVLARGYSLTTRIADGQPIDDSQQLQVGDAMHTRFAHRLAVSRVEQLTGGV
jgi:exodeoxyribonuclease VII large subunit